MGDSLPHSICSSIGFGMLPTLMTQQVSMAIVDSNRRTADVLLERAPRLSPRRMTSGIHAAEGPPVLLTGPTGKRRDALALSQGDDLT